MADENGNGSFQIGGAIDKVRASKAGHAFHEAWAARSALELLLPSTSLVWITLEGFDTVNEGLDARADEIADLVRYHGNRDIARATRVEIVQFKYSIASATVPIRAVDLAKTLTKFAATDAQLVAEHGASHIARVVRYDFVTNRPVHPNLIAAIDAVTTAIACSGDIAKQKEQIEEALEAYPFAHGPLLERLLLSGGRGSLKRSERAAGRILASWSEAGDPEAEKRLLKLRNLVRTKAGPGGEGDNGINRIAVLAELEVDHEQRLYPVPDAFPPVGNLIDRPIVQIAVAQARAGGPPLVVHAAGGMGKTVLMQSLAERLKARDQVITFDGFGAGRWRDPSDGRHRPERTLVHLANLLAGHGLCDILLPIADTTSLLRAFRLRLAQAVTTARQATEDAQVALVLDAIDHAAIAAQETGTVSFAHLLLRSLSIDPIEGVIVVASCRTERLVQAVGDAEYRTLEVPPFSAQEAATLILARDEKANAAEIAALEIRSGRNPRCLDTLLTAGRPYDPASLPAEPNATPPDVLDTLLRQRIAEARRVARSKGASDADIDIVLTGLSLLPPPVPLEELAAAHGIAKPQIESFAADLVPLLERTAHGLMFRDEPIETLIRTMSDGDGASRESIIAALGARQAYSNYASRALPTVLMALHRTDALVELAFDERTPAGASKVSQRDIRLARITSALGICAKDNRRDDLLRLLLEASIVAAGHEKSDRFLYEHPDLAAVAGDAEALRRLFSTKAGWPGGRHSALALAYAFVGDISEARRNARRAIDWHNWAISAEGRPASKPGQASTAWDDIGFGYAEMLAGNDSRVATFFARRGDNVSYGKFADLLDLAERHAISSGDGEHVGRLRQRVARCRLGSRALYAAGLRFSEGDASYDRRLIARLAAAPSPEVPDGLPASAVLVAVARAAVLGLTHEARTILAVAAKPVATLYDFTSHGPTDRESDHAVIAAGLSAALRGRAPTLVDLAPRELLDVVPPSIRARGPKAFAAELQRRLVEHSFNQKAGTRRGKKPIHYEDRDRYRNALSHRIAPLLPYAEAVFWLIRPPSGKGRAEVLRDALDKLERDIEGASNYPYRDGKSYLACTGFHALFTVADAVGAIDRPIAVRMAAWLGTAPGLYAPQLTAIVTRLSRLSDCHDAALQVAAHVERFILLDTDTATRISSYGALARAVWRVSPAETAAYFRRALDLADAFGSEDFNRTNHLLELISHYDGPPLAPAAGHDLARIFELNQPEAGKFPWIDYARTMVPVAGLGALAIVARLDDRNKARLTLTLGPLLTILVTSGKLSPDLAACLLGLSAPGESWSWRFSQFVEAVLPTLPVELREWLFGVIVVEIDRNDQLSPLHETIQKILGLARSHLPPMSRALSRIEGLAARRQPERPSTPSLRGEGYVPEVYFIDLADPDAIDRAIKGGAIGQSGKRWPQQTLADLALGATTPAKRLSFVAAVVSANAASLADKLRALADSITRWSALSPALRDALPDLGLKLAAKHAVELVGHEWESIVGWRDLISIFGVGRTAIVEQVVSSLGPNASEIGGDSWLALAAKLAPSVGPLAFAQGLDRFLAISGATLPQEVGDGPFDASFAVGPDSVDAIVGLIWSRLGHPRAAMRWRGAHAVRRLGEVNRFDVIDQLVARFDASIALPFGDPTLPFYVMHARLWLLIALARIAKDHPSQILAHRALLERVAFAQDFPHVVMRAFATAALHAIASLLDQQDRDALLARLAVANRSPFPHRPQKGSVEPLYAKRPDGMERPDDTFHLDYDFNKYQADGLSRVFGCPGWEIEDGITRWIHTWDSKVRGMYECPRFGGDHEIGSWSSGSIPEIDRYGGYLGWHALMLVAGEMLQTRPVTGQSWDGDPWRHFLSEYGLSRPDGLWLADATDLFPLDLPEQFSMPEVDRKSIDPEDHRLLGALLGVSDGKLVADWMLVSGIWSLGRDITLTVRTVLANCSDAEAALFTVLTDEQFFRWLPHDDEEIARHFGDEGHSVRIWLKTVQDSQRQLDRHDPYACSTAMQRPAPDDWVQQEFGLSNDDAIVRRWSAADGPAFSAEAWGASGGRGESQWDISGERIFVSRAQLVTLLERHKRRLVCVARAQLYHREKKTSLRAGDTSAFSHRALVFTLDAAGRVWAPTRLPAVVRAAVEALPSRERFEFHRRFNAIRENRAKH